MYLGKNIRLRAIERTDIPLFTNWINDPDVIRGLTIIYPMGLEDETRWFDQTMQLPLEEHPLMIEIKEGKGWKPIGNCGFIGIDWRNANAEVGIVIGEKEYWNKGVGSETMMLLLKVAFEILNLHRIWLRVYEDNQRAIRCYQKIGFQQEGRFRDAEFRYGKYLDVLIMSVLRPEWKDEYHPGV